MSSICFTGAGKRNGKTYHRTYWAADARACGFEVHDKVYPHTDYLVASRSDTTKAEAARRNGTTVISYDQFEQLMEKGFVQARRAAPSAPPADPAVLKKALEEAEASIEGWGMF
jgi:hypothetical protein